MKYRVQFFLAVLTVCAFLGKAEASERLFTYSYEPETMPEGAREYEQSLTWRHDRGSVKKEYNRFDIREELEYGINDNWTFGLYLNEKVERFKKANGSKSSESEFKSVSLENRFLIWNPAEKNVGLTLYIEPSFGEEETELEEKIILGQRRGDWKWTLNLTHETEWEEDETTGIFEITAGVAKTLNKRWALGAEFRNHNKGEDYQDWDSAFFLGPVVSYRAGNWWATVSVLPQIGSELNAHERLNVRCLFGFDF